MHEVITTDPEQTRALGRCLGQRLGRSLVLRLTGDLGSGKTCFVQGLAEGLEVPGDYSITSPTYTLINEYPGRLPLFHIDLYRLASSEEIELIGFWEILGMEAVMAVEWAERVPEASWPPESIAIEFKLADNGAHLLQLKGYGLGMDDLIKEALNSFRTTG